MPKLNTIMLIDDDHVTNVYHTVIIKRAKIAENIVTLEFPEIALDHLDKACNSPEGGAFQQFTTPELIFLDYTMPRMTGLEFLMEYQKIRTRGKVKSILYMLTASLHPSHEDKYLSFDFVKGVLGKPLTTNILHEIVNKNFQ